MIVGLQPVGQPFCHDQGGVVIGAVQSVPLSVPTWTIAL
jgi:hypothetical protein